MSTAYICILIAAILPYLWVVVAKTTPGQQRYDNRDPRGWIARQEHPRVRHGNAAQLNAFEAFPAFAASVLMAQFAGVDPARISLLAMIFVACRVLHGLFYIGNVAPLRSLAWAGGLVCVLTLMVQAARAIVG